MRSGSKNRKPTELHCGQIHLAHRRFALEGISFFMILENSTGAVYEDAEGCGCFMRKMKAATIFAADSYAQTVV